MTEATSTSTADGNRIALVFGASGEQGRAVMEGLVDHAYDRVYGFTRLVENPEDTRYLQDALGCTLVQGDIANGDDVRKALAETKATRIFLVTTTELPSEIGQTTGCWNAMEAELEVVQQFFDILVKVHKDDGIARHVVFSTKDNVHKYAAAMTPMDDGSLVPHYTAKGRGADYAMALLKDVPGLTLTLITLPFVYSNFLGFFTPLPAPAASSHSLHQWSISASLGDGTKPLDMMAVSDLSHIVRKCFIITRCICIRCASVHDTHSSFELPCLDLDLDCFLLFSISLFLLQPLSWNHRPLSATKIFA
jgi:nucleoside-diphosphate-sugar epimerase